MLSRTAQAVIAAEILLSLGVGIGVGVWQDVQERIVFNQLKQSRPEPSPIVKIEKRVASPPLPATLARAITVSAKLPEEQEKKAREGIHEMVDALKKQPNLYSHWLELGILRKFIGDYQGAEEIWKYTTLTWPNEAVSFSNLANLYKSELSDLTKAEQYTLLAIEKAPYLFNYYYDAYELYRFVLKDDAKARDILLKGKERNPGDAESYTAFLSKF